MSMASPSDFMDFQDHASTLGWYAIQLGPQENVVQFFCECRRHTALIADAATDHDYYEVQLEQLKVCDKGRKSC